MNHTITVKLGTHEDFQKLITLDYSNTSDKMFCVECKDETIRLLEIELEKPFKNNSTGYIDEIKTDVIPKIGERGMIPLVGFCDNQPAGYLMAKWESWPNGEVMVIDGILVANQYHGKGVARAMIQELIRIAKENPNCRGVHAEMDTEKHQACKLLLRIGFVFAGSKLYIYSNDGPHRGSKEAIYFYYKI